MKIEAGKAIEKIKQFECNSRKEEEENNMGKFFSIYLDSIKVYRLENH